ncbi:MAG: DNA-processing protein DprA [Lachnospiraceae bacterium]
MGEVISLTPDEYWYWLCNIEGIGARKINKLLQVFHSPKQLFEQNGNAITQVIGLGNNLSYNWERSIENIEQTLKSYHNLSKKNIQFITIENPYYPEKLKTLYDMPYGIYVKGSLPSSHLPSVAIVGARSCTKYGTDTAEYFGSVLASYGVQVISGMALGIDAAGHWGALKGHGSTFAILGCGVDICYPKDNIELYIQIASNGGLLSEIAPGQYPRPYFFPIRNRIISCLSDCIVVIEAREKSGALITVDQALEQGKDIFAVPGRIGDPLSVGCNNLIKFGANIVTKPEEILDFLKISYNFNNFQQKNSQKVLAKEEKIIYACLSLEPKHIEDILLETGFPVSQVTAILLKLELKGYIDQPLKNYYTSVDDIK